MERLRQRESEIVAKALGELPVALLPLIKFDLFCGDAHFAGQWTPAAGDEYARFAEVKAYVLWGRWHTQDRRTMVVFPKRPHNIWGALYTALHEIGHVLHGALHERTGTWEVGAPLYPVTKYAHTNYLETFAEAFATWFYPARQVDAEPEIWPYGWSKRNADYFDGLAAQL
jgi:hypothetical protein